MDKNTKKILLTVFCGFTSCLIFGLLFNGLSIFNTHDTRFQIVISGLFGSLIYAVMNYRAGKELFYVSVLFVITSSILRAKTISLNSLLMDIVLITAIYLAVYYYKLFIDKNNTIPLFLRALILLLFFALSNVLGVVLLYLFYGSIANLSLTFLFFYSKIPALIGFALGIGFDFFERYKDKLLAE